jgi:hypothetical protein
MALSKKLQPVDRRVSVAHRKLIARGNASRIEKDPLLPT